MSHILGICLVNIMFLSNYQCSKCPDYNYVHGADLSQSGVCAFDYNFAWAVYFSYVSNSGVHSGQYISQLFV